MIKKILKLLLTIALFIMCNYTYADINDSTLVKNRYDNVYAVYDAPDRVHIYYAQRYTLNGITAYCIEPGLGIDTDIYSSTEDWQITNLTSELRNKIRLIAYYGYDYPNHNTMYYYLATQELIWKEITKRSIYWVNGEDVNAPKIDVEREKNIILNMVSNHTKTPSFDNQTIEVNLNEEKIITDENNVLNDYEIYETNLSDVSIDGNTLKLTVKKNLDEPTIKLIKKHYTNSAALIYYSGNNQKMMRSGILDPVIAIANVKVSIKAKVKVTKADKDYHYIIKKSGIKFKIKNNDDNEYICPNQACLYETNEEGYFITDFLNMGNYQIEEVENQDIDGYLWNSTPLVFTIDENSEVTYENNEPIINLKFENKPIRAHIRVYKNGESVVIKNGQLTYEEIPLEVTYKLYANEDIYAADGTIIYSKNQKVINFTTYNGGHEIQFLPLGKYCLEELSAPTNYLIPTEPYCFSLDYVDRYTTGFRQYAYLKNYLAKGSVTIIKKDSVTNKPLSNSKIAIYTENDELIMEAITDEEGKISLQNIPLGNYYYKELLSPLGYKLDSDKHYFVISENEQKLELDFLNEKITGTFNFIKTDYDTNKPLPDTVIEIYNELDELMYHEITNQDGEIIIENIPYGKYYFKEIKAPDGYTIDNDKYYFEIKEDNEVISANMKNERIPVPNTYLNDKNVAYIISLCLIIIACFLLKNKRFYLKILAIFLVTIAITIPIYQNEKQVFITKTIEAKTIDYIKNTSKDNKTSNIDPNTKPIYNYIAVLEIPKINLKQGLVNKYSKYNNVKYNIEIIDGSNYPNINGTNFILAAHSGTSKVAYFKDLNKLTDDDIIYLYYLGNKYTYKINKHYEVLKTGYIDIERDRTVNAITLITCKDDDYQLVYLGYLINIETY